MHIPHCIAHHMSNLAGCRVSLKSTPRVISEVAPGVSWAISVAPLIAMPTCEDVESAIITVPSINVDTVRNDHRRVSIRYLH